MKLNQKIRVPAYLYRPRYFDVNGIERYSNFGTIVELLSGGCAVKFDDYANVVDYSVREARQFIKV